MNKILFWILVVIIFSCNSNRINEHKEITVKDTLTINSSMADIRKSKNSARTSIKEVILSDTIIEFQNKVFEFGSKTHLTNCSFYFECDCCYGDLIFKPDFTFYHIDHCMDDITVTRGTYSFEEDYLVLNSDSIKIQELYNRENEVDTSAIDYIVSDSIIKPYNIKFAIQSCESTIKLIDTEEPSFIALKTDRKAQSELQILEKKGIVKRFKYWDKRK